MDRNNWRIVNPDMANPVNAKKGRKKIKFQWKPAASPPYIPMRSVDSLLSF
jgi:hypothetical protein